MEMWKGMYKESQIVSSSHKNAYDNFQKKPSPPIFHSDKPNLHYSLNHSLSPCHFPFFLNTIPSQETELHT